MNTPKLRFVLATCLAGCALFSTGGAEARSRVQALEYSRHYAAYVGKHFGVALHGADIEGVFMEVVNGGDGTAYLTQALIRVGLDTGEPIACTRLIKSRMFAESMTFGTEFDDDAFEAVIFSTCGI